LSGRLIAAACLAACLLAGPATADDGVGGGAKEGSKQLAYGLRFMKARDYPRAIVHLTAAIRTHELSPRHLSDAYYFRGRALTRNRRPELALDDFTRAVTYWPENVKALRVRCRALTLKGEEEKARADCDQAVLLAPDDWRGWFTRGLLRDSRNERDLALSDFSNAKDRMPKGLETFPDVARQLRAYGLLDGASDAAPDTDPLPSWQEE